MKKKYLYNGSLVDETDVMDAAKQSNVDIDTYIKKAGMQAIDDTYSYKGKDVPAQDILDAAKKSKLGFDDYIQKGGFEKKNQIGNASGIISSPISSQSQDASSVTSPKNIFYVGDAFKQKETRIPEWQPETKQVNPKYPIQRTYNGQTIGFKNKDEADFYEQNNKVAPERNIRSLIMGEPKPVNLSEATEQDKTEHGNRFGYIMNNLVDGISSEVAGANDLLMQGLINVLPQSVVGGDKNEAIKQWRKKVTPQVRETLNKNLGDPISQNKKDKFDNEFLTSAIGGLMHTVPAILSPKGTKAAAFFTQAYDNGIQTINSTENGKALPENTKTVFGAGVGTAQAIILSLGIDKILGKGVNKVAVGLANKTFNKLLQSSTAPITADLFDAALNAEAKNLKSQLVNAGAKTAQSAIIGAAIGGALEGTDMLAKDIANKASDENIFEPKSWGERFSQIGHSIASGAVGGGLLGALSLPFSKTRNYISEKVSEAKSQEDIIKLKQEVQYGKGFSEQEHEHVSNLIDDYVRVNSKIPDDTPNRTATADKIMEREDIQNTIAQKQQEINNVDEAFQPEMSKEIDVLSNKVDEINNEITKTGETEDIYVEPNKEVSTVGDNTFKVNKPNRNEFKNGVEGDQPYADAMEQYHNKVADHVKNLTDGVITDSEGNKFTVRESASGAIVEDKFGQVVFKKGKFYSSGNPIVGDFKFDPKDQNIKTNTPENNESQTTKISDTEKKAGTTDESVNKDSEQPKEEGGFSREQLENRKRIADGGNNFPTNLKDYSNKLYKEISTDQLRYFLPNENASGGLDEIQHFSDSKNLALGQHGNKGVILKFDSEGIQGAANFDKPGLRFTFPENEGEYKVRNSGNANAFKKNLREIEIKPDAKWDKADRIRAKRFLDELENNGWEKHTLEDGTIKYIQSKENTKPNIVESKVEKPHEDGKLKIEDQPLPENTEPVKQDEPDSVTSIQNSIVDKEREKRGLPPAALVAKKEFGKTWDNAYKTLDENPNASIDLVEELKKKPRPISDEENALLLHRQITLQNQYDKVNESLNKAADENDAGKVQENRLRLAALSDALQDVYNVGKSAGTENARGLATRQMLAKEDYTLASMETKKRAANNGRPLTDEERTDLQSKSDRIAELEKKVADLEKENALPKQPKNKTKKTDKDFSEERDKILKSIQDKLKKSRNETSAVIVPYAKELIAIAPDVAKLVKSLVEQGVTKLEDVVDTVYGSLKGHIPEITTDDAKDLVTGKYDQQKQPKPLTPQQEKANAELERNKLNFKLELEKDRKKNADALEKGLNTFTKWSRAFKLSSPITLAKLTMAALYRTISTPIEEAIGAGYTKVLPKSVTRGAYREAGLNVKAEARAITKQFTQGMKDAYATINFKKGGRSDLEILYGKEGALPPEAADFLGHLHGALKAPLKRAEFERAMEKRTANMIKAGIDVTDPLVQTGIALDAYKDAKRTIFMQDNAVAEWWQRNAVGNPKTDLGKFRAAIANFLVPFVKIPTNIVAETGTYAAGVPIGAAKLASVLIKGIEKATPEQKDAILRNFKKGSIGAGFLLMGYFNPKGVGGYYTGKRSDEDVSAGGLRVFGHDIPTFMVHNPLMEQLQIGATVRRVADSYIGNTDEQKGIGKGILEAGLGLTHEIPFVNTAGQLNKLFSSEYERNDFVDEMVKNTVEPALLQSIAKYTDSDVKRKPEDLLEHLKMGIPGLREQVSAKHSYTKEDYQKPAFKYFTDKGLSLPYTSEKSITIKDPESGTIKKLSKYPQSIKDAYFDKKKEYLEQELSRIEERDKVYIDMYGEVSETNDDGEKRTKVDMADLTRSQYAKVLSMAALKATEKVKKELFKKKK